ncbi:MAG: Crp/Fnr family transcriptional regulator [Methylicorpusculum sp.]|uniref:Crp/Fnr family transcriptional regulator n=1 Tax=Methylicorpusculum sp. TaxID=2713644 RepID=UPI0027269118|nr:Crp/Fnr family transcriptional regulator [Methylicorpusculum sp.]MDO8938308.1 Crp/Fnr family transcriptional regulator [Methylicorpusculum sp.]MDP2200613.1 Crp/Fnr family transcriptional regulator [Methylicorpusculum sp.]
MNQIESSKYNMILGALPRDTYNRLLPYLEWVQLAYGEVIYESGREVPYAYFPTTSIVSKVYLFEDGASSELALVGSEGFVGLGLFMGGGTLPHQAIVSRAGGSYRLRRQRFLQAFDCHSGNGDNQILFQLLLRFTQAMITQIGQNAVCNRHHSIYQQLSRWLLLNLDRQSSNELILTQEHIAHKLGVRRESITKAVGQLQQKGLISYHRGHLSVTNRSGLEDQVCECYKVVKAEFDRLLPVSTDIAADQYNLRNKTLIPQAMRL